MDDTSAGVASWEAACTANEGGKAWLCTEGFGGVDDSADTTVEMIVEKIQGLAAAEIEEYIRERLGDTDYTED